MTEPTTDSAEAPDGALENTGRQTSTPRVALLAAVVLGLAAILTAWGSVQDPRVSGDVVKFYAEQQALTATANDI
jgi:hypothetical protein